MRSQQLKLLSTQSKAYGGELLKKRKAREQGRPLSTKNSMHLVLRSSKATGTRSFRHEKNARKIERIVKRFAKKYGVTIHSLANVGNHLHFHIKLANRHTYPAFIRAVTGSIALAITGASRLKKNAEKFWDYRPYTRVVVGLRAFLSLRDYVKVNQWEGYGLTREHARFLVRNRRGLSSA